ncbi:MAG: hypothetical protein WBV06_10355 [Acidimicrobiia bacterium]
MFTVTNITVLPEDVLPEDVLPEDIDSLADTAGDEGHAMVARLAADFRSGENRFEPLERVCGRRGSGRISWVYAGSTATRSRHRPRKQDECGGYT